MIRRLLRRGIRIGAIVGAILFLVQIFLRNPAPKRSDTAVKPADRPTPPPQPTLTPKSETATPPAGDAVADASTTTKAWADPVAGECPPGYPVKVKLASGIFHVPGGLAYDRTVPDRCYVDAESAEKDGFRQSKR